MSVASDTLIVGKIGAPYGVKGWVKINSFTQNAESIFDYEPWKLGTNQSVQVDQWRFHSKALVAKLVGVETREDAELIKNLDISISSSQLPELENDFYWKDLIGMKVITDKGYDLGTVKELFETGSNDVMMVKANPNDGFGQKERLLPFIFDQVVVEVDKQGNTIKVDWDPAF
ncbi:ribosome maturation factor RimM [Glaciecola siphonariae]|uniref:Ribosome maturation factor RimM n=1 Tax=Glaciecola siphonariae TaxID=521012 RepID=A0ABV9LQS7_9ALTE